MLTMDVLGGGVGVQSGLGEAVVLVFLQLKCGESGDFFNFFNWTKQIPKNKFKK